MKKRSLFKLVLLLILCSTVVAQAAVVRHLSAAETRELLIGRQVFLLDVRTPGEYQQVRMEGAHLIPMDQLTRRLPEIPANQPVLVYCAVGSRSAEVARYLQGQGYREVYNMYGGIWAWQLRGYPVVQGGRK